MVPVRERRGALSVISEAEEIEVAFDTPDIAKFGNKSFNPPSPLPFSDDFVRIQPNSEVKFELVGEKAGNTTLVIKNRQGKALTGLLVSVKSQINKTYALCRLSDMRRPCPWPASDIRPMMQRVERTFLQQANVKLSEKPSQIFDVNVNDRDLGDPLIPERIIRPANTTLSHFILFTRSPTDAILVDFTIFFTWNLRQTKRNIVGQNFGQACFVEFLTSPFENGLTTAHELGHGLGLNHTSAHTLMAGDGESRSSSLQQFEIDTINQSTCRRLNRLDRINMPLVSNLFRDNARLGACLTDHQSHVTPGAVGEHVHLIQVALMDIDGLAIDASELTAQRYGPSTASAVLAYKKKRKIINRSYQNTEDNIVGKMTIASPDQDMADRQYVPRPSGTNHCYIMSSGRSVAVRPVHRFLA
jgi:hypothetical protein